MCIGSEEQDEVEAMGCSMLPSPKDSAGVRFLTLSLCRVCSLNVDKIDIQRGNPKVSF